MANEWMETPYGRFSADFCVDRLSNLCDPNAGIQTGPFGSQLHQEDYVQIGTPIITVEHLDENRILHANTPKVFDADRNRLSRYQLNKGDIVFSRVGSVDRRALVREEEEGWLFSGRCLRVRPDPTKIDSQYLSYFFGLSAFKEHIRSIAVGATMPSLNTSLLSEIAVPHPPNIKEQRAIAHILGTLDDKIELNRKQNETLEAMARTLFKAWFVDFEPVRAKMEGRWQRGQSLPGLPAHLYDLFPDRLVDSELGEIPEGWATRPVGDFAVLTGGKQLEREQIAPVGDIPVFGGAGVMGYAQNYNADGFVIAVGRVGAYCGQFFSHRGKAWINNNASLIRQRGENLGEWLFLSLRHADIDVIKKGAAQPFVSNGDIAKLPVIWPGEQMVQSFSALVVPILMSQEDKTAESKSLAQLRDTLLPKLISGELRVPDAETFLRERGL